MCGICGEVKLREGPPPLQDVTRAMLRVMRHRGPDGEGWYGDQDVALGAVRLAIIDLAGGQQPIHNADQTLTIVFNGEIYNFAALRSQLERLGHRFTTHSDTEVILKAYEEFGAECVLHLNGIFAFAIWDQRRKLLFIGRDRMGIKPLYYAVTDDSLIFASELKVMLAHPRVERHVDLVSLNDYLTFEYVPTPRSIIKGVKKLPPGHTLTVQGGRVEINQFWDVRLERSETGRQSEREYQRELLDRLEDSVKRELVSDVPVGVLLSGGLDSSAIAVMAARHYPGRIKTFTAAFEDASFDESRYARLVARGVGAEHHEMTVSAGDLLALVPRLGELVDEPLGDSSFVPTYLLSQFVRKHVKVALGGDGGDELFAGYPTYQAHRLIEYYEMAVPQPIRRDIVPRLIERLPTSFDNISLDFRLKRFISARGLPIGTRHHQWLGSFTPEETRAVLEPWAAVDERDVYEIVTAHQQRCAASEPVNQLLYCDMKMYLEGDILQKVDRASMASSLEVRVPLLNRVMVEWATRLPHDQKLRGFTTKYLFRKALRRILPAEIIDRKKKGFNMPVAKWLAGPLRDLTEDTLSERRLREDGYFQPQAVRRLLDEHYARRKDNRKLLWTLLIFQLWLDALKTTPRYEGVAASTVVLP
ncbi:MAG: asparagine synthase (glutamine-hydrolyzing) [Chloroflexi bacterium]|nr:asparagine synthase (glutamine-hydrolyzing) [Chloroflexota bacterium]